MSTVEAVANLAVFWGDAGAPATSAAMGVPTGFPSSSEWDSEEDSEEMVTILLYICGVCELGQTPTEKMLCQECGSSLVGCKTARKEQFLRSTLMDMIKLGENKRRLKKVSHSKKEETVAHLDDQMAHMRKAVMKKRIEVEDGEDDSSEDDWDDWSVFFLAAGRLSEQ